MLPGASLAVPYEDLVTFGRHMLESQDIDPVYPVLRRLQERMGLTGTRDEQGLWLTVLYQAFYNLPSALAAFHRIGWSQGGKDAPIREVIEAAHLSELPIGVERRGLRGGLVLDYLKGYWRAVYQEAADWYVAHGDNRPSQRRWMRAGWSGEESEEERYLKFWDQWQTVPYNGRWSAFKTAELLKEVHDFPMSAPDMRMQHCSGPREGLIWLYSLDLGGYKARDRIKILNEYGLRLRRALADRGLPLSWEHLETVLCNFNSMRQGRYYVGHDIDEMQTQILAAIERNHFPGDQGRDQLQELILARREALPERYLGEYNGRRTIDHDRMVEYALTGRILTR
jgi:hypothetical protein